MVSIGKIQIGEYFDKNIFSKALVHGLPHVVAFLKWAQGIPTNDIYIGWLVWKNPLMGITDGD